MPDRIGLAFIEGLLRGDFDDIAVFRTHLDDAARIAAGEQRFEDRFIIDIQHMLIGHKDLKRIDSLLADNLWDLSHGLIATVRDRQMKSVVDTGLSLGLGMPRA